VEIDHPAGARHFGVEGTLQLYTLTLSNTVAANTGALNGGVYVAGQTTVPGPTLNANGVIFSNNRGSTGAAISLNNGTTLLAT
jgi:hypothetical protein